jgi:hypothetical protein
MKLFGQEALTEHLVVNKIKLALPVKGIDQYSGDKNIDIIFNADFEKFPAHNKKVNRMYKSVV